MERHKREKHVRGGMRVRRKMRIRYTKNIFCTIFEKVLTDKNNGSILVYSSRTNDLTYESK